MSSKRTGKVVAASALSLALIAGGTAAGLRLMQGEEFLPGLDLRALRRNQVVFDNTPDSQDATAGEAGEDSSLWEKDKNAQEQNRPDISQNANYLFQMGETVPEASTGYVEESTETIPEESKSEETKPEETQPQPTKPEETQPEETKPEDTKPEESKPEESQPEETLPDTPAQPGEEEPTQPEPTGPIFDVGGDDKPGTGGTTGGNTGESGGNSGSGTTKPPAGKPGTTKPVDIPSIKVPKDPESKKEIPGGGMITPVRYDETVVPSVKEDETEADSAVLIYKANVNGGIYRGQSVTDRDIYRTLLTCVTGKDGILYFWDEADYDKYFRISAVSFDGGVTWITEFPVEIPLDTQGKDMLVRAEYRLKTSSDWTSRDVNYVLADTRVMVLRAVPDENDETLDASLILNSASEYYDMRSGTPMNLLQYVCYAVNRLTPDSRELPLTQIFAGWSEDGKIVPWYYKPETVGRHVLLPTGLIDVPQGFTVMLKTQWLMPDYSLAEGSDRGNLAFIQAVTAVNTDQLENFSEDGVVSIPQYIQGIAVDADGSISGKVLEIPDTVLTITANGRLEIENAFRVSEGNPMFASDENGILTSKDGTKIFAVPTSQTSLTVGEGVQKVALLPGNQVEKLILENEKVLPEISFDSLENCKSVVVSEELVEQLLVSEPWYFSDPALHAAVTPEGRYWISGRMIFRDGTLVKILNPETHGDIKTLNLPNGAAGIGAGVLDDCTGLDTLVLPTDGGLVTLEKDCLKNTKLKTVYCTTRGQVENIYRQLSAAGAPENVEVLMLGISRENYTYYVRGGAEGLAVHLASVPEDITVFDGVVTAQDGSPVAITEIDDQAFQYRRSLKWVELPESVKTVGVEAFAGCSSLEGVVLDSRDTITLEENAFSGCGNLYFFASNAQSASIATVPTGSNLKGYYRMGAEGYPSTDWLGYDVYGYTGWDMGQGLWMLYLLDEDGTPFAATRTGSLVPETIVLPDTTREIAPWCLQNTFSASGSFTVNWEDLTNLLLLGASSFSGSGLSGEVNIQTTNGALLTLEDECLEGTQVTSVSVHGDVGTVYGSYVFSGCEQLTSVDMGQIAQIYGSALRDGLFNFSDNLQSVTIGNSVPPELTLVGYGTPFHFNWSWTPEEESQHLKLHVPEGSQSSYIQAWRYVQCGYSGQSEIRNEYWIDMDTFTFRTDEEIDALVYADVLSAENRLRSMMDLPLVSEPTEHYTVRENFGYLTLAGIPSYKTELSLDGASLGLPDGWYLDYIGANAFANAPRLHSVTVPDNLVAIEANAFAGNREDTLEIYFQGETPPALNGDGAFDFGSENLRMYVPAGAETAYLNAWIPQLAGYTGWEDAMQGILAGDEGASANLLAAENRLRTMLGMDTVTQPSERMVVREENGYLTLAGVLSSATELTLDGATLGLPEGWYLDYIGSNAFVGAANLQKVIIPADLAGIEPYAFAGNWSTPLNLVFQGATPPSLNGWGTFSFGSDNLRITVPEGAEEAYLEAWAPRLAGYMDRADLLFNLMGEYPDIAEDTDALQAKAEELLLPYENQLRTMMGLPEQGTNPDEPDPDIPGEGGTESPGEGGTDTPGEGGTENPGEGGTDTPGEGGTENPSEGGTDTPGEGGTENPGEGGTENPSEGGTENPSEGGTENPSEGGTENPGEGGTDTPGEDGTDTPGEGAVENSGGNIETPPNGETQTTETGEGNPSEKEEIRNPENGEMENAGEAAANPDEEQKNDDSAV